MESLSQPLPTKAGALVTSHSYPLSPWEAIRVATQRQATLVLRDRVLLKGRVMQVGRMWGGPLHGPWGRMLYRGVADTGTSTLLSLTNFKSY